LVILGTIPGCCIEEINGYFSDKHGNKKRKVAFIPHEPIFSEYIYTNEQKRNYQ
jgi:hypothetical protein